MPQMITRRLMRGLRFAGCCGIAQCSASGVSGTALYFLPRLLGLNAVKLMSATGPATNNRDRTRLGDFFEALVALSLQTYAAANDAQLSPFRDHDGRHEIDFVIHREDAEAVGIEVKLKSAITDQDVRHLLWLKESLPDQIVDLVVINTGTHAYRRQDGVAVIPLALLTA
ncbi:DUF4143 domain-containing protein [Cryobacterium levicorallinum]|uniref:DUF4143 domain-containing protein n=3 Tax=Cryobacterium levicorallinum TaxID=995038 RepID=A0A4R8VVY7_9MICO|nr:DUF4143 domain-containing protein [Cryobacterium levicorallinum]GEP25810.1 hypothetical protein CLE01_04080 [Cryobacterium levicorallinum]